VLGCGAAASSDDVQPALPRKVAQDLRHLLRRLVVTAHLVWQAGVRVAADIHGRDPGQLVHVRAHLLGAQRAVDPDCEQAGMGQRDPGRLGGLAGKRPAAAVGDREGGKHRNPLPGFGEVALDGEEGGFEVERVEAGLGEQQVDSAGHQAAHLFVVGLFQLIEGHGAEGGVVHVGRDR